MTTHRSAWDTRLDRGSDEPLWLQLSATLREAIADGTLAADQALPSESELISRYGVSRTVVREALAELVRRGLIYKIRAKGSFVSPSTPDLSFIGSTLGSSADLDASNRSSTTRILSQLRGTATAAEAGALQIEEGEDVLRLRRLRSVDGAPWLLVDTVMPASLFPGLLKANLENQSLYKHLRRHYGVSPAGADRWLQAVLPSAEDAGLLALPAGAPALRIESVSWDADDRRFEFYNALHRSDDSRFYVGIR
ncbi:GntR family transcriptional regulator [Mycetocola reblochoni]|uniref:Transcriptional regulator, GntR family n=2 Tax=Mycetocola reblochoni TaxID=331618 RepID=A0A1R4KC29_9MICO|nr:GntR family transcriptional regulator [Mycetocola reblochoni]RLP68551.1 GntR family transcriptional regulator [Mycetocola reblochoni]SJN41849.1 Transcriptional regulator, GntR family [Mycetocola reblochoni REB411]